MPELEAFEFALEAALCAVAVLETGFLAPIIDLVTVAVAFFGAVFLATGLPTELLAVVFGALLTAVLEVALLVVVLATLLRETGFAAALTGARTAADVAALRTGAFFAGAFTAVDFKAVFLGAVLFATADLVTPVLVASEGRFTAGFTTGLEAVFFGAAAFDTSLLAVDFPADLAVDEIFVGFFAPECVPLDIISSFVCGTFWI